MAWAAGIGLATTFCIAWMAHAAEPPPKELAQRLDLARMLPQGIGAAVMMRYIEPARIERPQKAALAFEAYLMATGFGVEAPPAYAARRQGGPIGWLLRSNVDSMNPAGAALQAWKVYQDNYDAGQRKELEFPPRRVSKIETCRVAFVDDPYNYYDAALAAGPKIFSMALTSARYAIDLGRLARAVIVLPAGQRPVRQLADLLLLQSSDRQFAYAMEFTALHISILRIAREGGPGVAKLLMERYAGFLQRHWKQRRCAGNEYISYRGIVEEFNQEAASLEAASKDLRLPRIAGDAWWAVSVDPESYSERDEDLRDLTLLRLKIAGSAIDDVNATSVLREVEEFRPPDRLPVSMRHLQRQFAFHELLRRFENTEWERKMMAAWLYHIAAGRLYREAPQVWWAALRDMTDWIGKSAARRAMVEASGDSAMAAWFRLEALDGR
jgi:hypothetical protein